MLRFFLVLLIITSCEKRYFSHDFMPDERYKGVEEISIIDVSESNYDSLEFLLNFLLEERIELIVINDSSIAENITEEITNHLVIIPRSYSEIRVDTTLNKDFYKSVEIECKEKAIGFFKKKIGYDSVWTRYHPAAEAFLRLYPGVFDDFLALDDFVEINYYYGAAEIIVSSPNDVYLYDFKDVVIITNLENEAPVNTPYECYYNPYYEDGNQKEMKSSHVLVNSIYTLINNLAPKKKSKEFEYSITQVDIGL